MPLKVIIATSVCHIGIAHAITQHIAQSDPFLYRLYGDTITASPLATPQITDQSGHQQRAVLIPVVVRDRNDNDDEDLHPHDAERLLTSDEMQADDTVIAFFVGHSEEQAAYFETLLSSRCAAAAAAASTVVRVLFDASQDFISKHAKGPFSTEQAVQTASSDHPTLQEAEALDGWLATIDAFVPSERKEDRRRESAAHRESLLSIVRRRLFTFFGALSSPTSSSSSPTPLSQLPGFITSGNVRVAPQAVFGTDRLFVDREAVGHEGDVVFGRVVPPTGAGAPMVFVMDGSMQPMYFNEPFYVVAPLGNRESSTHVSGAIPYPNGVQAGRDVTHWIAGESGMVGVLQWEGSAHNALAERSVPFEILGVVVVVDDGVRRNVNLLDLAKRPLSTSLRLPIFAVAGTSAEAGKTTFASKLVRILSEGLRCKVGAVKATGTGGVVDCQSYVDMGAHVAKDQVDVGLPSTYTSPERVRDHIGDALLLCQDAGCDVLVVEFGGDLIWANGPVVMSMPMFYENVKKLFVICNDTFSAMGVLQWLREGGISSMSADEAATSTRRCSTVLTHSFRDDVVSLVASPFRNYGGAVLRAEQLGPSRLLRPLDPNNTTALSELVTAALKQ